MTGDQLVTMAEELNGGASINETLLYQLLNLAKAMVEQRRPWMILRNTDTSKTVTASTSAWQTAISLVDVARFSRFYGDEPVKIFDGQNRIDYFRQVPWQKRLECKDHFHTFVYDEANKQLYLNGSVAAGTLYIEHLKDSPDIEDDTEWIFPSWAHPLLAYMAVAMHKGGIDYDDINARMAPENQARADAIVRQLEAWDNDKQHSAIAQYDPSNGYDEGYVPKGRVDIHS